MSKLQQEPLEESTEGAIEGLEEMLAALQDGDVSAGQRLVEKLLPWVFQVARDLSYRLGAHVEEGELYGPGVEGLLEALRRYDPLRGAGLRTFCKPRIRGAMLDEVRRADPVPRSERLRVRRVQAAQEELTQKLSRPPAEHELASSLGLRLGSPRLAHGAHLSRGVRAFSDLGIHLADGQHVEDTLSDPRSSVTASCANDDGFATLLRDTSDKERAILELYYAQDLSMREIGERLGICESRVSQIHKNVLARLRAKLASHPERA
ncbi:MAG: sigma-70 family RNA polymerase sigma factor [Planctomycetes bacterium]|nr:sigma-70 family RNA polymerase sigma factor [Planctomycetota bacterium]